MVATAFGILDEELRDRAVVAKTRAVWNAAVEDDDAIEGMGITELSL